LLVWLAKAKKVAKRKPANDKTLIPPNYYSEASADAMEMVAIARARARQADDTSDMGGTHTMRSKPTVEWVHTLAVGTEF
jgi:hypothetical protein